MPAEQKAAGGHAAGEHVKSVAVGAKGAVMNTLSMAGDNKGSTNTAAGKDIKTVLPLDRKIANRGGSR
ncbi:hypothetical protein ABZP36_025611 [Zizania latifolia]